jgi:hypothetical protein
VNDRTEHREWLRMLRNWRDEPWNRIRGSAPLEALNIPQ